MEKYAVPAELMDELQSLGLSEEEALVKVASGEAERFLQKNTEEKTDGKKGTPRTD